MNRLAPQTDAAHLAAVKKYLADHLRGAPMPDVWLESLEAVIRMAENNGRSPEPGKAITGAGLEPCDSPGEPPAQLGSDTLADELRAALAFWGLKATREATYELNATAASRLQALCHKAGDRIDQLERELAAAKEALAVEADIRRAAEARYQSAIGQLAAILANFPPHDVTLDDGRRMRWEPGKEITMQMYRALCTSIESARTDAAQRAMGEKT